MEGLVILLVVFVAWLVVGPVVAMVKASGARRETRDLREQLEATLTRLKMLESEVRKLKGTPALPEKSIRRATDPVVERAAEEEVSPMSGWLTMKEQQARAEFENAFPEPPPLQRRTVLPTPHDLPQSEIPPEESPPEVTAEPFSLEKFMGVKLFAWLGGVALFFGVIFFVKLAFENNLIPPPMRIALGFVTGAGLLAGGLFIHRLERYKVLAQVFCATGVLILYGVSFAAHSIYHFAAFGTVPTFVLMAVVTFVAFLIAVRLNALVVAVLGMLGGFMTPVLLSTGQDQALALFGYIALLDAGLLAVSRHGRWRFLTPFAAAGTVLMQAGWYEQFFHQGRYSEGSKILVPMGILSGFLALFLAGSWIKRRRPTLHAALSVFGLAAAAVLFSFLMLSYESVAERYFLLYGFLLLVHLGVIATVMARPQLGVAQVTVAVLGFVHLACWTTFHLTTENLHGALAIYLIFGALHAVVPVIIARWMPARLAILPEKAGRWFAPLALFLMVLPILHLEPVPMVVWVAVLMADLLVIALAVATGAVVPVLVSLAMTMGVAGIWLFKGPSSENSLMPFLGVITGFSMIFAAAGKWLFKESGEAGTADRVAASNLTMISGVLPFVLLILALLQLPVTNPSPVFGVALLMTALLAGLAIFGNQGKLILVALAGTFAVEGVWYLNHFNRASPDIAAAWFLGFYALFLVLPFVFRKRCTDLPEAWIASALSGVAHFLLVHGLVKQAFPNHLMGLVPAAFAVPSLLGLSGVLKSFQGMDEKQQSRLAWFGGVALLFITLIFPIQFERQWITVSWAVEGALLLWLFRRVPHPGLLLAGFALLATSFVRLTFNPAVFTDYARGGTPVFNWHLYAYGVVAAAQFLGAKWFTDPSDRMHSNKARGVLFTFGGILLFLLLNIEIADYFTAPGDRCIAFQFGGNFPRDMTYSISWGLFSLSLLGLGFWSGSKHARFAAVGLLVITLIKVFLHDLAAIQNIFRIGALLGVAVIAFIASFLYQRFFDKSKT